MSTMTFAAQKPILLIGATYANSKVPFNAGLVSPLLGLAVKDGSYVDINTSLKRFFQLTINEAQAGASTLQRPSCDASTCYPGYWDSYETQLDRAIQRVKIDRTNPASPLNADYVFISTANDCLHPNAFGIPWNITSPCTLSDFNDLADRYIAIGQKAIDAGLTPIFTKYAAYEDLDFPLFQSNFGFPWVQSEADYNLMRSTLEARITSDLPDAIYLDIWSQFTHIGDGIHPDESSVTNAALNLIFAMIP